MKKVLVSGYIGFNNFGDEAIFYALSSHLKSLGYEVSVLCNNKKDTKEKYDVETYGYKKPLEIIKAILNCDVLISGGGSLLQNKTSNFSLFYYLFILFLAKLSFKKTIIFAQGIEPIKGIFPKFITKEILKLTDNVTVRDKKSQELLKKWNINSNLVSDPAYSLVQDRVIKENKTGIIVQLRKFNGIDDKFLSNLADNLVKTTEEITVLSLQDDYDKEICQEFIKKLENKNINTKLICNQSIEDTIEIINQSKYMISVRLHGLIISNALRTKTFALCYDEKIKTFTEELNLQNIDILNYTKEELDKKLDEFFNHELNEVHPYRHFEWEYLDNSLKN